MGAVHARLSLAVVTAPGSATRRGYGQDWRRVRLVVLERDGFVCHWCFKPANTVDHVHPLALAGARLDPTDLVACCRSCNSRKRRGGRQPPPLQPGARVRLSNAD